MQQLLNHINRQFIGMAFALFSIAVLSLYNTGTVNALGVEFNSSLKVTIGDQLNVQFDTIVSDLGLLKTVASTSDGSIKTIAKKLVTDVNAVKQKLANLKNELKSVSNDTQAKALATKTNLNFALYHAANQASQLLADLHDQVELNNRLNSLYGTLNDAVQAAAAKGATHINAGVAGFISLDLAKSNLDKLRQSIDANTAVINSVTSMLSAQVQSGLKNASNTAYSLIYGQLSVTKNTLNNLSLGLSQLSNLVTGNRFGISYCGIGSNCNGNENKGFITACGIGANCVNNTNNGTVQACGVVANCTNNTNNGIAQVCGALSNCANSTNNNGVQTCGIASDCANSTNNGVFVNCGVASNCSGSTNNGIASLCGALSNCKNATNNGGVAVCGVGSSCSGSTNNSFLSICGVVSNCTNQTSNGLVSLCGLGSDCSNTTTNNAVFACGLLSNCSTTTKVITNDICVDNSAQAYINTGGNSLASIKDFTQSTVPVRS